MLSAGAAEAAGAIATLPRAAAPATVRVTARRRAVANCGRVMAVSPWLGGPVGQGPGRNWFQAAGPTALLPRRRRTKGARPAPPPVRRGRALPPTAAPPPGRPRPADRCPRRPRGGRRGPGRPGARPPP